MSELEQYQTAGGPIFGSTAREIASSVETAIRERLLDAGETLPTVRALAATLGTSPATVNSAYGLVRQRGLIVTGGRRGTRVAPRPALRSPERGRPSTPANQVRDLSIGLPDPALVPPIAPALQRIDLERTLRISALDRPDPELHTLAVEAFAQDGLPADAVSVFSGAFDAIERVLQ